MKYSVLTYIFNDYEFVREVKVKDPEAEYLLITDNPDLKSETWKVIYASCLNGLSVFDKCYYVRFHPFEFCNTNICFRIDGSVQILDSLSVIVNRFIDKDADLMLMLNPVHNYLHEDYEQWVLARGYPRESANKALTKLLGLGYDKNYRGYYQATIVIEKNNEITRTIDERTYKLLKELGENGIIDRFDQPVWSFVINQYNEEKKIKVMPVTEWLITFSSYLKWCFHNSDASIPVKLEQKPPYLFDELVVCEDFSWMSEAQNENDCVRVILEEYRKHQNMNTMLNLTNEKILYKYKISKFIILFLSAWVLLMFLLMFV